MRRAPWSNQSSIGLLPASAESHPRAANIDCERLRSRLGRTADMDPRLVFVDQLIDLELGHLGFERATLSTPRREAMTITPMMTTTIMRIGLIGAGVVGGNENQQREHE
jgi:hypothetical protein